MSQTTLSRFRPLIGASLLAVSLVAPQAGSAQTDDLPAYVIAEFGTPPAVPEGPLPEALEQAVQVVFVDGLSGAGWTAEQQEALDRITAAGDPRLAWLISDMMRFSWQREADSALAQAAADLLGITYSGYRRWDELTNHLMAWDIPAYPDYLAHKRGIFTRFVPGWDRIFVEGDIDWRMVSWGGVLIDDRPFDTQELCNCIPAVDNPPVETAAQSTWLREDDIVFGLVVNGEARAYPRQIMEVREMVNDTLGGRDLGLPYCSLCGAMQAYFTDNVDGAVTRPVLRTSGLLIRSNKVMYDRATWSVFDTFLGHAVTGPLAEAGVQLEPVTVLTTTWGAWKEAHPDTTVLVEALALGRNFDFRNTRDANGPIFPVGDVDPRLGVQADVIGVIAPSGRPLAFERGAAQLALQSGAEIRFEGVRLMLEAGGIRAVAEDGADLGFHEAFWFAWSQFHPDTALWTP